MRPLRCIVLAYACPCAGGSWTQLSNALLIHSKRSQTPSCLWVIGLAVCRDKHTAILGTIWVKNRQVFCHFIGR